MHSAQRVDAHHRENLRRDLRRLFWNCRSPHAHMPNVRHALNAHRVRGIVLALALVLLWPPPSLTAPTAPLASFPTEKEAQEHCQGGLVVWLDVPSKVYYYRGQQRYGATAGGAYVCRDEAKSAGMRATRSPQ